TILQPLIDKWQSRHPGTQAQDRRVEFILASLHELDEALRARGGGLVVLYGDPVDVVPKLAAELEVDAVFANHDYEPAAIERDEAVRERLSDAGRALRTFKDQVIFERAELL
ncbi:deoxyribodipyrimidine photo-lyase, partial [Mesorhizobium sp. M2D.F.Ca.ET.153.01.1.1]